MNTISTTEIQKLSEAIKNANSIVLTGHQNPDPDCVGSSLGLYHFLKLQKENIEIILPNRFPKSLKWMSKSEEILIYEYETDKAERLINNADLIFSLDYNDFSRTGEMQEILEKASATKVIIDHHPQPNSYYDISFSDITVSSASELVYAVISQLKENEKIPFASAESLFTGIMTDTGCFAFNSSTPETYHVVSELLEQKINKDQIKSNVFDNYSIDRTRLMGYVLSEKMVVLPEFRTAYIVLTQEEKEKFNYQIGDSEGFVNLPLSIKDIIFSVFIIEHEGMLKFSLRSKGSFDVNKLARTHFNGGGHKNAAGGRDFDSSYEEIVTKLENLLPSYKEELLK